LIKNAQAVITDSGGITEETTIMNIPCLSLRTNTERPETVDVGSTELVGSSSKNIKCYMDKIFENTWKKSTIPKLWDGKSATRIVKHLETLTTSFGFHTP
jgi:UDP-N-acetylglucosamine 2-epimerase (non-hydrolysing)